MSETKSSSLHANWCSRPYLQWPGVLACVEAGVGAVVPLQETIAFGIGILRYYCLRCVPKVISSGLNSVRAPDFQALDARFWMARTLPMRVMFLGSKGLASEFIMHGWRHKKIGSRFRGGRLLVACIDSRWSPYSQHVDGEKDD